MTLAARHFDTSRPVVVPGQRFALGRRAPGEVIGTVRATDADGGTGAGLLGNWQIIGGTGAGAFMLDRATGEISFAGRHRLDPRRRGTVTLEVVVDDRKLTSKAETVAIDLRRS